MLTGVESIMTVEDLHAAIAPFRIFKRRSLQQEPDLTYGDTAWLNSSLYFPKRFKELKKLSETEQAKVCLYKCLEDDQMYVLKFVRLQRALTTKQAVEQERLTREVFIAKHARHPHIIDVKEIILLVDCMVVVMEYAAHGELFDYVQKRTRLSEFEAKLIMFQLLSAVDYLHSNGIVHRDLKLENVLLDGDKRVRIADFGFANYIQSDDKESLRLCIGTGASHNGHVLKTSCGSPCYAAPEIVICTKGYDGPPVDIWSCGVIMYAMLYGQLPFESLETAEGWESGGRNIYQLYQHIVKSPLAFPAKPAVSPAARDLLRGMLSVNPRMRLKMGDVVRHAWFANASAPKFEI